MVVLTAAQHREVVRLLREAVDVARERAADHSYRRDACRAIGERELATFHQAQWVSMQDLAQRLYDRAELLAGEKSLPRPKIRSAHAAWALAQGGHG